MQPVFVFVWLCLLPAWLRAQSVLPLPTLRLGDQPALPVPPSMVAVWTDSSAMTPPAQVWQPSAQDRFRVTNTSMAFGLSDAAIWLRFRVFAPQPGEWLLESSNYLINDLQFYALSAQQVRSGQQPTRRGRQGTFFLAAPKDVQHNLPYFRLAPPGSPPDTITVYLRAQNTLPLTVPLRLLTMQRLAEDSHRNDVFQGLLFGILLAMALYNAVLFFTIRDLTYLYYVLYVLLSVLVTDLQGYANEFVMARFFPDYSRFASFVFSFLLVFVLLFSRRFLNLARHAPRLNRALPIVLGGCFLPQLFILAGRHSEASLVMEVNVVLVSLLVWGTGIYLLWRGVSEARYFVLAWAVLVLGAMVFLAQLNGILPRNLLTVSGVRVGAALETILLSFALADRIRAYQREKKHIEEQLQKTIQLTQQTQTRLDESEKQREETGEQYRNVLEQLQQQPVSGPATIAISTLEGLYFVRVSEIVRCESDRNYTQIFLLGQPPVLASKNLGEFDALLTSHQFFRVHNSHLINLAHVRRYVRGEGGQIELADGSVVEVSRRRKDELLARLMP